MPTRRPSPPTGAPAASAQKRPDPSRVAGRRTPSTPPREDDLVALRLAIGRAGVGIELAAPVHLGCLLVTELTATLPGMRFPLDVSGGVPKFRHRRGILQTLQIEMGGRALEQWAAPRLRGVVSPRAPEVWLGVRSAGATVCVTAPADVEHMSAKSPPVVAFDLEAVAEAGDLWLVVRRARGTDLPAPATAVAIACAQAMLSGLATRDGAVFVVRESVAAFARAIMPQAGARVPAAEGVGWTSMGAHTGTWVAHAARGSLTAAPTEEALRAREIASALREADDALVAEDLARARALCLEVLERAPRHGEVARRVLQIDAATPGRAEAALATFAELARWEGEAHFGTTPGELLAEVGDLDAAMASLERAGDTEPAAPLAARAFEIAARLARDPDDACRWLDRALARAPRSAGARWLRIRRRLELGRVEDALADVEHVDAQARGGRAKYAVWLGAGQAWRAAGLGARAGELFERALRHAPDDVGALAGLGAALLGEGRKERGVAVLTRAVQLLDEQAAAGARPEGSAAAAVVVDLARALAEQLDDLPAAIARAGSVPAEAPEALVARGLEGRWRAALGDAAGAALAFARLRELASSLVPPPRTPSPAGDDARLDDVVALLLEGAAFQESRMRDPLGAQRALAVALRLRPHDPHLRRLYRDIGAIVVRGHEPPSAPPAIEIDQDADDALGFAPSEDGSAVHATAPEARPAAGPTDHPPRIDLALPPEGPDGEDEIRDAARAEELTRRLQGNPADDEAADELATLLERLGRGHELLALAIGRLEDATPERRPALAARARGALERLAAQAETAGRREEAALYRSAIETLPA